MSKEIEKIITDEISHQESLNKEVEGKIVNAILQHEINKTLRPKNSSLLQAEFTDAVMYDKVMKTVSQLEEQIEKEGYLKVYLGCDLFTEGQRWQAIQIEEALKEKFGDKINIYNPANNMDINDKESFAHGTQILWADYQRLKESDILIALLDTMDTGLCAEMGIAFERGIPIYQLHTDIRLTGNTNQTKLNEISKDVFQNDFMYRNKLVTALSYMDKNGKLSTPAIYKNKEDLVADIVKLYL